jgi:hypothetical protein
MAGVTERERIAAERLRDGSRFNIRYEDRVPAAGRSAHG